MFPHLPHKRCHLFPGVIFWTERDFLQRIYPFEVFLSKGSGNLPKNSKVKADQIRTLDKARLVKEIGKLDEKEIDEIEKAIKIHLGLMWAKREKGERGGKEIITKTRKVKNMKKRKGRGPIRWVRWNSVRSGISWGKQNKIAKVHPLLGVIYFGLWCQTVFTL